MKDLNISSNQEPVSSPDSQVVNGGGVEPGWTREALLKAVADCVPPLWAWFMSGTAVFKRNGDMPVTQMLYLHNDVQDAAAIMLMLDIIEQSGRSATLYWSDESGEPYKYSCLADRWEDWDETANRVQGHGPTRAWAVASCFVAVFGKGTPSTCEAEGLSQPNEGGE